MLIKLTNQVVDISLDNIKEVQKKSLCWDSNWTDDYILIEYQDKTSQRITCSSTNEVEKDYNIIVNLIETNKRDIGNIFETEERQKMWNEIVTNSSHYKELQQSMEFGYAQGIVAMLNILKENENLSATTIRGLYIDSMKDSEIDKMVRRLMK